MICNDVLSSYRPPMRLAKVKAEFAATHYQEVVLERGMVVIEHQGRGPGPPGVWN